MTVPWHAPKLFPQDALERYAVLGPLPENTFERPLRLATRLFQAPIALIVLGGAESIWFKSGVGPDWRQVACPLTLWAATLHSQGVVVVPDVTEDARFASDLPVIPAPGLRFYAGVPLVASNGQILGTLCVLNHHPHTSLPGGYQTILTDLASLAVDELELQLKSQEVSVQLEANQQFQNDLTLSRVLQGVRDLTELGLALEEVLARVADLTATELEVDWVGLTTLEGDHAVTRSVWHRPTTEDFVRVASELHCPGGAPVWRASRETVPTFVEEYPQQPGARSNLVKGGLCSAACVRVSPPGVVSSVVTLVRLHRSQPWGAWEQQVVEAVARTLQQSQVESVQQLKSPPPPFLEQEHPGGVPEEAQRVTRQAQVLLELSQLLGEAEGIEQIAPLALAAVGRALGDGWLVLWRRDGEVFRPLALFGSPPEHVRLRASVGIPASHYEALGVLAGQRVFLNAEMHAEAAGRNGPRGTAAVPVLLRPPGRELILGAYRAGAFEAWSPFERDLLITAGRVLTVGAERQQRLQTLAAAAHTDPLTGLGNRRAFAAHLEAELKDAAERGGCVGVLSLDLDGLKAVNDREGHLRGDALLVEFARALCTRSRGEDQTYRLGGDEYALVLPGVCLEHQAAVFAQVEAAVRQVRGAGFMWAEASAGLACFPADGTDLRTLVEVSDGRMYQVKSEKQQTGDSRK